MVAAYAELARHFPRALWETYGPEIGDVRRRLSVAQLIVAECDGQLVGAVTFYPRAADDGHDWPSDMASFRLLAVDPAKRGAGVGALLVQECIRRGWSARVAALGLHTAPFMEAATRLYETIGFRRAPEYDFDPDEYYGGGKAASGIPGLAYVLPLQRG